MGHVQYPWDETWVDAGVSGQVLGRVEAHYAAAKRQDEYGSIANATGPSDYSNVSTGFVHSSSIASTSPANDTVPVVTVFVTPSTCVASPSRRTSTMTTYTTVFVKPESGGKVENSTA
ncbi:hypothetical protein D0868_10913 [Hortaea werneckii]|uniref:Uncharacterized protein n=1 Tax=Hortaea werneckii TaxID=91943 RepID=A0A3M6Y295_HORWE|nr:hypothetical protein D0868_10913 [Hortaea werneckii]